MDITYHYPPELFSLLVTALPRLNRSKPDVLVFFKGAGVGTAYTADIANQLRIDKDNVKKHEMVRTVLQRLNDKGEAALRERREVLKRVVEWEDFSVCWDNDRLQAIGLVESIRKLVEKKDAFARMEQAKDEERRKQGLRTKSPRRRRPGSRCPSSTG
jgi:restriction system protein